jgi:putative FmdB family regulatory protein
MSASPPFASIAGGVGDGRDSAARPDILRAMPIYEYRCRACGDTFDELRPPGEADAPVTCACGAEDSARLPSLIARGSGGELPLAGAPQPAGGGGCCGGGCCS